VVSPTKPSIPPGSPLDRGAQLSRLVDLLGVGTDVPLGAKAQRIVEQIIRIWQGNGGHFTKRDADDIQAAVLAELSPQDFKDIAKLSFANWATPARLTGPGLPHLNRINESLGRTVASLAQEHGKREITVLDLGAGLLSTTAEIVRSTAAAGIRPAVTAVDATPPLVHAADAKLRELLAAYPGLSVDVRLTDMLEFVRATPDRSFDFVVISFAIHHLHPTEQVELVEGAFRVLHPGGAFLVADPQEGRSDFNLKVLIYEEPEAIFAAFTSPTSMTRTLAAAGFTGTTVLIRDDIGHEGYALYGVKPVAGPME
jgi:2-polyprenyl-3-methyl-5-hydroxy-6-metoxy-1,4-benzoquinol methylase